MIGKILLVTATMMMVAASAATVENAESINTLQQTETLTNIPDSDQIMADLIGHQMYVSEGLPGIWVFSSAADIQNGNISGTRLNGDSMEFDFTLVLMDNGSSARDIYRAKTLVTYKKQNESWVLVQVQDVSFKASEAVFSVVSGNFGDDC